MALQPGRTQETQHSRIDELVEISARLFVSQGYDATSMQEIADEMGILKGSIYHYVRTKEDLLWMIVEPRLSELVEDASRILGDHSVPVIQRTRDAIALHTERFEVHFPYMVVITRENGETISAGRREHFTKLRDDYYDAWKGAIADGIRSGELRSDLHVSITVQAIFGMLSWMFRWFRPDGSLTARQIGELFATIVLTGIAPPASVPVGGGTGSHAR